MSPEFLRGLKLVAAIIGLVASILGILLAPREMRTKTLVLISVIVVAVVVWIIWGLLKRKYKSSRQLPPVKDIHALTTKYSIHQASRDDIDWIAELERDFYSAEDAIPKHVLEEWYGVNPSGFFVVKIPGGQRIGHLDVLPLKPGTLNLFLQGKLIEREIRGDSLYSPGERNKIKNLYIESVILNPPSGCSRSKAFLFLICKARSVIEKICDPSALESIYAIAASTSGSRNMSSLGFNRVHTGDSRKDRHDLFGIRYSDLERALIDICDEPTATPGEKPPPKRKKRT